MFTLNGLCAVGRGYVAADPELQYFEGQGNNRAHLEVSISFQRYYKKGDEFVRQSHFIPTVFYGNIAERFANAVCKGKQVMVSGFIEQTSFTPRGTDKKVTKIRLIAEDFCLVENTNGGGKSNGKGSHTNKSAGDQPGEEPEQRQAEENTSAPPVNPPKPAAKAPAKPAAKPAPEAAQPPQDDGTGEEVPDLPF